MDETRPVSRDSGMFTLQSRKIRFEVVEGPDQGLVAELPGPDCRIGTGSECDLVLKDPTVSRLHLDVRIEGNAIRIIDAGSRNGTLMDGIQIRDAYARPDSTLVIGNSTLRLRMLDDIIELPLSSRECMGAMIGKSVAMRRVFALLERLAPTDETLLIEGETGTGKELAAEAIHEESLRAQGPYIVFDCSAASGNLIESELFGHTRGAFTTAVNERAGLFETAEGGTLFLDEIGELPLDLQPRLLRVLERREVRRMGANTYRRVDVRIVAATNRSLAREVECGRFREDLYYRLAVLRVALPPLRERVEDIPLLIHHFERTLSHRPGASKRLPDDMVSAFAARAWPGNVRELRNAVSRALSLGNFAPGSASVAEAAATAVEGTVINLNEPLLTARERVAETFEKAYLELALKESGGNITRAANRAQVNRKFIQRAMKQYGLRGDNETEGD